MRATGWFLVLTLLAPAGCEGIGDPVDPLPSLPLSPLAPRRVIELPSASYAGLAVTKLGIIASRSLESELSGSLVVVAPASSEFRYGGAATSSCRRYTDVLFPMALDPQHVATLKLCVKRTSALFDTYSLERVSLPGADVVPLRLPTRTPMRLGPFAYDRAGKLLVTLGDSLCGTVTSWTQDGLRPLDVVVPSPDGGSFNLATLSSGQACGSRGTAGWPVWLDSTRYAFLAAPDALGRNFGRLDADWYVFQTSLRERGTAKLLSSCRFQHARALTVAAPGLFVLSGSIAHRPGTWLLNSQTDEVSLVSEAAFGWVTIRGNRLFGLEGDIGDRVTLQEFALVGRIYLVGLPAITGPLATHQVHSPTWIRQLDHH